MNGAPAPSQIRAQVAAIREKAPDARVIGIRAPAASWPGGSIRIGSEELDVAACRSVLELREIVATREHVAKPVVVLTELQQTDLGADLVARLARRQLFYIDPWQLVKERFRARWVDPRLVQRHKWVPLALLEAEPEGGYPPAPSGFIESETVWRHLCEALLGLPQGERDPEALLGLAIEAGSRERLAKLSAEVRDGLTRAVAESAGSAAGTVFSSIASHGARAFSIGLVARVLFATESKGDERATKARGKLEAMLGLGELEVELANAWAAASETVLRRRLAKPQESLAALRPLLADADALLRELGAEELAHHSATLQSGYEQRLERLAHEVRGFAEGRDEKLSDAHRNAAESVLAHALSPCEPARIQGVEMALRAAGWLAKRRAAGGSKHASLVDAAAAFRAEGGFADWARSRVWDGDTARMLAESYSQLARAVDAERENENKEFAQLLSGWLKSGSHDPSLLPIEDVLDLVVAPLAKEHPTLLVVIDAMSAAVFRELEQDLMGLGWVEIISREGPRRPPVIAAIPTVTEASRTSLLCGRLVSGLAPNEKEGFSKHPALVAASEPVAPPILFHKADLKEAGGVGVAAPVIEEVANLHRRVVGVVINAVDDHLAKGDQVRVRWTAHSIRPLEELLAVAQAAGRVVVMVSDHGHVLERETEGRKGPESERWRDASIAPAANEVLLEGPRVVLGSGGRLVAPWSERVRFGMKKNGYHGGASPQEVVIPLAVFATPETAADLGGWIEAAPQIPEWWTWKQARQEEVAAPVPTVRRPLPRKGETGNLFAQPVAVVTEPREQVTPAVEWVERLFTTALYQAQRKQAARTAPPDERVRLILAALDERGGKLTRAALAGRLGVAPFRLGGILSALRRVLNVDGYDVLAVDEASDTVQLNRELLLAQFEL